MPEVPRLLEMGDSRKMSVTPSHKNTTVERLPQEPSHRAVFVEVSREGSNH
jgi:hypothetical protein